MTKTLCTLLSLLLSGAAAAATPPCTEAPYRAFDFWIGTWDVHTTDGQLAGTNRITAEEQGCLLVERWRSTTGVSGQSYNFYDTATGRWRQLWVSPGAIIDYAGNLDGDDMVLEGTITNRAGGTTAPFRGRWSPLATGQVRQHFEQWDDATQRWEPWFTGIYSRAAAELPSAGQPD
ncbi:MAG: hypothetical protein AAGI15_11100 [Pseudomonadota bacterium]